MRGCCRYAPAKSLRFREASRREYRRAPSSARGNSGCTARAAFRERRWCRSSGRPSGRERSARRFRWADAPIARRRCQADSSCLYPVARARSAMIAASVVHVRRRADVRCTRSGNLATRPKSNGLDAKAQRCETEQPRNFRTSVQGLDGSASFAKSFPGWNSGGCCRSDGNCEASLFAGARAAPRCLNATAFLRLFGFACLRPCDEAVDVAA